MKQLIKLFILKGLCACGLGPIVLSAIYLILLKCGIVETIAVSQIISEILTVTLLAFIAGGINVIYKIEKIPLSVAILIHAVVLYIDYIVIYLFNGWLNFSYTAFLMFTIWFVVGYAVIWAIIFWVTKNNIGKLNKKLAQIQNDNKNSSIDQ